MANVVVGSADHHYMSALMSSVSLRYKLVALGAGSVLVTAAVLVGVGAWQSDRFADRATDSVGDLARTDLNHVAEGTARLVDAVGSGIQERVNKDMAVARAELAQRGGLRFDGGTATWQAVNQVSKQAGPVSLPGAGVAGQELGQNRDPGTRTRWSMTSRRWSAAR